MLKRARAASPSTGGARVDGLSDLALNVKARVVQLGGRPQSGRAKGVRASGPATTVSSRLLPRRLSCFSFTFTLSVVDERTCSASPCCRRSQSPHRQTRPEPRLAQAAPAAPLPTLHRLLLHPSRGLSPSFYASAVSFRRSARSSRRPSTPSRVGGSSVALLRRRRAAHRPPQRARSRSTSRLSTVRPGRCTAGVVGERHERRKPTPALPTEQLGVGVVLDSAPARASADSSRSSRTSSEEGRGAKAAHSAERGAHNSEGAEPLSSQLRPPQRIAAAGRGGGRGSRTDTCCRSSFSFETSGRSCSVHTPLIVRPHAAAAHAREAGRRASAWWRMESGASLEL